LHSERSGLKKSQLDSTDSVLGKPDDVRRFLEDSSGRLSFGFRKLKGEAWELDIESLPPTVRLSLNGAPKKWKVAFLSPTPEGISYIGRNHQLVESLSEYLMDLAFHPSNGDHPAARCGVIRTNDVNKRTTLFLLRLRYLVSEKGVETPTLAEETLSWGFIGLPPKTTVIDAEKAQELLDNAKASANVPGPEKTRVLKETLSWWDDLQPELNTVLGKRAENIQQSNTRLRKILKQKRVVVEPQTPPDLLGIVVLLPVPGGGQK
jgi:hypothetical protein